MFATESFLTELWHIYDWFLIEFCNWQISDRYQTYFWQIYEHGGTNIDSEYQFNSCSSLPLLPGLPATFSLLGSCNLAEPCRCKKNFFQREISRGGWNLRCNLCLIIFRDQNHLSAPDGLVDLWTGPRWGRPRPRGTKGKSQFRFSVNTRSSDSASCPPLRPRSWCRSWEMYVQRLA